MTDDANLRKIKPNSRPVLERGSRLIDIYGVGPASASRILADVCDVARFADRNRFASWTVSAPLDARPMSRPATASRGRGTGG